MNRQTYDGWCLMEPGEILNKSTFSWTQQECWARSFNTMPEEFQTRYYRKWDASIRAAKKVGYRFVKVEIREV